MYLLFPGGSYFSDDLITFIRYIIQIAKQWSEILLKQVWILFAGIRCAVVFPPCGARGRKKEALAWQTTGAQTP